MSEQDERVAEIVASGKARGLVALWGVGAYTDKEAFGAARQLLTADAPARVRELLDPMLREIRKRQGWQ